MRIALCDDSRQYLSVLESYADRITQVKIECDVFESGEELVKMFERHGSLYDAVFLDMEMGGMNGLDTANMIRSKDRYAVIFFVTSHKKYMQESFACGPLRFLLKPVSFEEFQDAVRLACKRLDEERKNFVFIENRATVRLFCEDILYFESAGHLMKIHTRNDKVYQTYKTMAEVMEKLDPDVFALCFKSIIVNMGHIKKIGERDMEMDCGNEKIPVSRTYKNAMVDKYMKLMERKYWL